MIHSPITGSFWGYMINIPAPWSKFCYWWTTFQRPPINVAHRTYLGCANAGKPKRNPMEASMVSAHGVPQNPLVCWCGASIPKKTPFCTQDTAKTYVTWRPMKFPWTYEVPWNAHEFPIVESYESHHSKSSSASIPILSALYAYPSLVLKVTIQSKINTHVLI